MGKKYRLKSEFGLAPKLITGYKMLQMLAVWLNIGIYQRNMAQVLLVCVSCFAHELQIEHMLRNSTSLETAVCVFREHKKNPEIVILLT